MTTKAKEAMDIELSDVQYDAGAVQDIPLTIKSGSKEFDTRHEVQPLSDDRYFQLLEDMDAGARHMAKTAKIKTADTHGAKEKLYDELAVGVKGYKERPGDFREGVHFTHKKSVIDAVISIREIDDTEPTDEGWDIDALIAVPFHAMFSGALIVNLSHSFRPETKAEMDEYMALAFETPDDTKLASAKRQQKERRLVEIGRKLLKDTSGYKDSSPVPAWHLAETTERFFLRQMAQAGKL